VVTSASDGAGRDGAPSGVRKLAAVAQHADHLTQILQRLAGRRGDGARRLAGSRRRRHLQCACLQRQQRQPVAEHVVHLVGDA
jgi:hypothetical protein